MIASFDYASPSALVSERERALLGFAADARRPVRFHGKIVREVPLVRFALRALGQAIWSRDDWVGDGEYQAFMLDPVVTVHPDRIFFEAFTGDQSAYVAAILDPSLFTTEGEVRHGTTNIDFTAWLWSALGELRSSRDTWLHIDPGGFAIETHGGGGRFEPKVDVPDSWVRGFLQVQSAMALPGTRLSVRPVDLLSTIRFLRYTRARLSPRALRYEFLPVREARLVLEPWEHEIPLRGATHGYLEPRIIRTWGRRRLALIEPLLPFAERVDIYLKGRGLPSFYAVKLPGMTFLLGLSGWTGQRFSEPGGFALLGPTEKIDPALTDKALAALAQRVTASERDLAEELAVPPATAHAALSRLVRLGRAIFDVEGRTFRHRELFAEPIDEARYYPPDARSDEAAALLQRGAVKVHSCEAQETRKERRLKTPDGPVFRTIIHRDWRVRGTVDRTLPVEIVVDDNGRVIFGTCTCAFFQDNLLGRGPCAHMVALHRASEAMRRDQPSSLAAQNPNAGKPESAPAAREDDGDSDANGDLDDDKPQDEDAR